MHSPPPRANTIKCKFIVNVFISHPFLFKLKGESSTIGWYESQFQEVLYIAKMDTNALLSAYGRNNKNNNTDKKEIIANNKTKKKEKHGCQHIQSHCEATAIWE